MKKIIKSIEDQLVNIVGILVYVLTCIISYTVLYQFRTCDTPSHAIAVLIGVGMISGSLFTYLWWGSSWRGQIKMSVDRLCEYVDRCTRLEIELCAVYRAYNNERAAHIRTFKEVDSYKQAVEAFVKSKQPKTKSPS